MVGDDDWRLQGQERYLLGVRLHWQAWEPERVGNEHDHCEFCMVHFGHKELSDDPDTQLAGYSTDDRQRWICRSCFEDFRDRFRWEVVGSTPDL
jgi:hypothetical protein